MERLAYQAWRPERRDKLGKGIRVTVTEFILSGDLARAQKVKEVATESPDDFAQPLKTGRLGLSKTCCANPIATE